MNYSFRIQAACRIAKVNRDRLNEAIAAGLYTCAPRVKRGSTRVFDYDDLVVLMIYGWLLEDGFPPRMAGVYACEVRQCLRTNKSRNLDEILLVRNLDILDAYTRADVERMPHLIDTADTSQPMNKWHMSINLKNIRHIIDQEIEQEVSIIGEDDDE